MSFPYINAYQQFFDSSGSPLASGTIEFRAPVGNALINSYPTADDADAQANANSNPLTLNASGAAASGLYLEDGVAYKIILKDSAGATVKTDDDVRCPYLPLTNKLLEGSTTRSVLRTVTWVIQPGASPGTNINVIESSVAGRHYNKPSMTNATDLAKSGTSGSYSLNSGGGVLTVDLTEVIIGVLSCHITVHDINSSSTSEMYTSRAEVVSGNITIRIIKRGSTAAVDLTTIMDSGDRADIIVSFVTST